jgi:multiple antibiotic resistance protein
MDIATLGPLLVKSLATFFAVCNPIPGIPIFMSMTEGDDAATKKAVARRAVIFAFVLTVTMAALGKFIGELFGITLPAFKMATGILVFMIGYQMVSGNAHGAQSPGAGETKRTLAQELDKAISPLGTPLIAGGGAISAGISFSATDGVEGLFAVIVGFGIIMVLTYFCFLSGDAIEKRIGQSGITGLTKIMGLILLTIGVEIFLGGVDGVLGDHLPKIAALLKGAGH